MRRADHLRLGAILAAFLVLLTATDALARAHRRQVERSFSGSEIKRVDLENINGLVEVGPSSTGQVELRVDLVARGGDAADLVEEIQVQTRVVGERLVIETIFPERRRFFGLFSWSATDRCKAIYDLRVPAGKEIAIETVNGSIRITGIEGEIRAESVNGEVEISGARQRVVASTVNGDIEVERPAGSQGPTIVDTVNGSIVVLLPGLRDIAYDFETINGSIDTDFPIDIRGRWGPKSASGRVGDGNHRLSADTINGSIEVHTGEI